MADPSAGLGLGGLRNYGNVPEIVPDSVGGMNFEPAMQAEKMIMLQNRGYHDLRLDESGKKIHHGHTCCSIEIEGEVGLPPELEAKELCIFERNP
jgi:hypothetical protein